VDEPHLSATFVRVIRRFMFRNPRLLLAFLLGYVGVALIVAAQLDVNIFFLLQRYASIFVGGVLILAGIYVYASERGRERAAAERQFIDVDRGSKSHTPHLEDTLETIRREIRQLRSTTGQVDTERLAELIRSAVPPQKSFDQFTFVSYYDDLRTVLQDKASNADAKASLLLDRGVAYSKLGILFFIISIIVWQVLAWQHGFKNQFIYGIVSCSLLFLTIEFLSAWFLRQYVQFVDTSTYLMKVKSIFDRYLLTYLVVLDAKVQTLPDKTAAAGVLQILKDEIKWPDMQPGKTTDITFAREMMDSLASLAKALSGIAKSDKKTETA